MAASTTAPKRNIFRRIAIFWHETVEELRKASWPTWLELRDSTVLVIITVLLLGAFISMSDFSLFNLVTWLSNHAAPGK
jgi:preprotein translocase subunit SecE